MMPVNLEIVKNPGDGSISTPLLFVHGAWHGAWCWEPFLDYFAKHGYNGYALSLRGHGKSSNRKNLKLTRIDDYVEDVRQVVKDIVA